MRRELSYRTLLLSFLAPSLAARIEYPPCEVSMPFTIRPYRRFPVYCPVTSHAGLSEGRGTIWNVSQNGWRLSDELPLRVGQSFPMTLTLPNQQSIFVAAALC